MNLSLLERWRAWRRICRAGFSVSRCWRRPVQSPGHRRLRRRAWEIPSSSDRSEWIRRFGRVCIVGSSGIVMRESHPFDASKLADLGNVFHRTMAPALAVGIFFIRELGVMNHQVRIREKFAVTPVQFMHLRPLAGKSRVRFVVTSIEYAGAAHLQPIAKGEGGMVQVARGDVDVIDLEATLDEVMKKDASTELIECDWEVNVLHLSGKRVAKRLAETGRPIDIPVTPGNKQRRKKRKSLDVVPMRVTEQDATTQRSSGFSQH